MKFSLKKQNKINCEIEILKKHIKTGTIKAGILQRTKGERISQQIESYIIKKTIETFELNKQKFSFLKKIKENNGSSKSPYELLFSFQFENFEEIYIDLKPININKKLTAPFMGTINKHIKRLNEQKYYDLYFIIEYKSEIDTAPELTNIVHYFVKDITNFSIYTNWQLQISINKIKTEYGRHPKFFTEYLMNISTDLRTRKIYDFQEKCKKNEKKLSDILNNFKK